jgi:hypothetical protein
MYRFFIIKLLILFSILSSQASSESPNDKSTVIPLDKVWANKMPGTRDILDLDLPRAQQATTGRWQSIYMSWVRRAEKLKFKDLARPGFAVSGSGQSALLAAHAIFVEGAAPRNEFSPDEELTIVFFSEPYGGNFVRMRQGERKGEHIKIQYRLEPYLERTLSETFALIPLGKLATGEYHVGMRQLPSEQKFSKLGQKPLDENWSRDVLCKPFSFAVRETRE